MDKYIIYMTGTSGEEYKFWGMESTVRFLKRAIGEDKKFIWMENDEAINLSNIEHIKIHEIEEGERPR